MVIIGPEFKIERGKGEKVRIMSTEVDCTRVGSEVVEDEWRENGRFVQCEGFGHVWWLTMNLSARHTTDKERRANL
jgi:hypothetical protein